MVGFYRDYKIPEVERLARAIAAKRGWRPDDLVPESGYANSDSIPAWWKFQDDALNYIAMRDADASSPR